MARTTHSTKLGLSRRPSGIREMAGGNFMHRVMSYVVNELLVNSLANSPSFQRFAVRTSKRIEDVSQMALQKRQELSEQMKDLSKNLGSFKNQ